MQFTITHRENLVGFFEVEANSAAAAQDEYIRKLNNGEIDFSDMEMVDSDDIATPKFSGSEIGMIIFVVEVYPTPPNNYRDIAVCVGRSDKEFLNSVQDAIQSFVDHVVGAEEQIFNSVEKVIADIMDSFDVEWCFISSSDPVPKICRYLGILQI